MAEIGYVREFLLRVYRKHDVQKVRNVDFELLQNKDNLARLCKNVIKAHKIRDPPAQIQRMVQVAKQKRRAERKAKKKKEKQKYESGKRNPSNEILAESRKSRSSRRPSTKKKKKKKKKKKLEASKTRPQTARARKKSRRTSKKKALSFSTGRNRESRPSLREQLADLLPDVMMPEVAIQSTEFEFPDDSAEAENGGAKTVRSSKRSVSKTPLRASSKNSAHDDCGLIGSVLDEKIYPDYNAALALVQKSNSYRSEKTLSPNPVPNLYENSGHEDKESGMDEILPLLRDSPSSPDEHTHITISEHIFSKEIKKSSSESRGSKSSLKDVPTGSSGFIEDGILDSASLPDYQSALALVSKSYSFRESSKLETITPNVDNVNHEQSMTKPKSTSPSHSKIENQNSQSDFDEAEVKRWFALLDTKNEGSLTCFQLVKGFAILGIPLTEEEALAMCPARMNYIAFREIFLNPSAKSPIQKKLSLEVMSKVNRASLLWHESTKDKWEGPREFRAMSLGGEEMNDESDPVYTADEIKSAVNLASGPNTGGESLDFVDHRRVAEIGDISYDDSPLVDFSESSVTPFIDERLLGIVKESFRKTEMLPEKDFKFLWKVLLQFSADENKLDMNSIIIGFEQLEMPVTKEEADEMFRTACVDGSGLIDFERFKKLYGMRQSLKLSFAK